jgi:hypothetical protein
MSEQNDYFAVREGALMFFERFKQMVGGLDVPEGAELIHVGMSREGAVTLNWKKGSAFGCVDLSAAGGMRSGAATGAAANMEGGETADVEEKYLGVFRYLDCSTGHVTKADMDILDLGSPESVISYANEYGAFVHVPYDFLAESGDPFAEMLNEGFSESFVKVLKYAKACNCFWVKLDADGILHENLDHHTW